MAQLILTLGFDMRKSEYFQEIIGGTVPRLKWEGYVNRVPSLFNLSRDKIREQLIARNCNLTKGLVSQLGLPGRLNDLMFIFNPPT